MESILKAPFFSGFAYSLAIIGFGLGEIVYSVLVMVPEFFFETIPGAALSSVFIGDGSAFLLVAWILVSFKFKAGTGDAGSLGLTFVLLGIS